MRLFCLLPAALLFLAWNPVHAQTVVPCCSVSSDFSEFEDPTDPAQLEAEFAFAVTSGPVGDPEGDVFEVSLSVSNLTPVPGIDAAFNINEVFFNGSSTVLAVTLLAAQDSDDGDVTAAWDNGQGGVDLAKAENVGGMDDFRFALYNGTGVANPSAIEPGETTVFHLNVLVPAQHDLASDEFAIAHINRGGKVTGDNAVAAKFVSCIGVHCVSPDDSAFGGSGSGGAGEPDPGPVCEDLAPVGAECLVDAECCSNKCRGREGARSCK